MLKGLTLLTLGAALGAGGTLGAERLRDSGGDDEQRARVAAVVKRQASKRATRTDSNRFTGVLVGQEPVELQSFRCIKGRTHPYLCRAKYVDGVTVDWTARLDEFGDVVTEAVDPPGATSWWTDSGEPTSGAPTEGFFSGGG